MPLRGPFGGQHEWPLWQLAQMVPWVVAAVVPVVAVVVPVVGDAVKYALALDDPGSRYTPASDNPESRYHRAMPI